MRDLERAISSLPPDYGKKLKEPEFRDLDWAGEVRQRMANPLVVDGRNFLDASIMRDAGFTYEGVGR